MLLRHSNQKITMAALPSARFLQKAAAVAVAPFNNKEEEHAANLDFTVEHVPGVLWTTDLDLNITRCLGNGLARLYPTIHPVTGMPVNELFSVENTESPLLDAHYHALGSQAHSFEVTVGDLVFWGTVEPLFNADWDLIGTIGIATEIGSRKSCETERLQQLAQDHEADMSQALINLAKGLTRHFNRLFNAMAGYAAIVGMGLPEEHPGQRWIAEMELAAQRAADLANQRCPQV